MFFVYKIPYRRAPRLAYRLHRPSASREQRYLAYNNVLDLEITINKDKFY